MRNTEEITIPSTEIKFARTGSIVYPPGGTFGPRIQQCIQLVMLYSGEMNVTVGNRTIQVKPGHLLKLLPGHEEYFTFSRTQDSWHRWIKVHAPMLDSNVLEQLSVLPECVPLSEDMNRLLDLMLRVQQYTAETDPLLISMGIAALQLYPRESEREMQMREKHPAVYVAISWIWEHYAKEITLKDIADHAGVSSEHLVRIFRQHERTTPIQYVWQFRVKHAVGLLTNTGLSVNEIAHRCGFKTFPHFSRLVKKTTGHTPSELRQLSWGGLRRS